MIERQERCVVPEADLTAPPVKDVREAEHQGDPDEWGAAEADIEGASEPPEMEIVPYCNSLYKGTVKKFKS